MRLYALAVYLVAFPKLGTARWACLVMRRYLGIAHRADKGKDLSTNGTDLLSLTHRRAALRA